MESYSSKGLAYMVVIRHICKGKAWKTDREEFDELEQAESYAKAVKENHDTRKGTIEILIYELCKYV